MKKINWKEIQIWKKIPKWKGVPKWKGIPKGKSKKVLVCAGAGIAAVAIVAGIVLGTRGNGKTVDVYPFAMVGMTEYWGDNQESSGPVTTDKIQTVFLSDTQIITGLPVEVGAHVKKGDVLARLYAGDAAKFAAAEEKFHSALTFAARRPQLPALVLARVDKDGVTRF